MQRPVEYDNLIRTGDFKDQPGEPQNVAQYLAVCAAYVDDAKKASHHSSKYTLAYEGFFHIVQAILEFYNVRTTDKKGHRVVAIQRVCADLKMTPGEQALVTKAHSRRNDTIYRSPFPPVSDKEADAMLKIASDALTRAGTLVGSTP